MADPPLQLEVEGGNLAEVQQQLQQNSLEVQEAELAVQSLLRRQAALVHAMRLLQQKHLIVAMQQTHMGFQNGRPIAAMITHRCLLAWRSLEASDTATQNFLQTLISIITNALDEDQVNRVAATPRSDPRQCLQVPEAPEDGADPDDLGSTPEPNPMRVLALCAYWLTVTSTLLALLHRQIEEHPSYLGKSHSGSQRAHALQEDLNPSLQSAAAAKLQDLQNKLASKFSNFKENILKRAAGADKDPAGSTQQTQQTQQAAPRPSTDSTGHDINAPTAAQVFRHSLDMLLLQAYGAVRDAIKKQIAPLLPACIQEPAQPHPSEPGAAGQDPAARTSFSMAADAARNAPDDPSVRFTLDDEEETAADAAAGQDPTSEPGAVDAGVLEAIANKAEERVVEMLKGPPPKGPLHAWEELVVALQSALDQLRDENVPRILIKCIYKQLLSFIDSQLFNQFLLRPDCCSASNARHVLSGLKLLDQWIMAGAADSMMKPLFQELKHIRQAAQFLVTPGKADLSVEDLTGSLCPSLSAQQIYRLCTTCWDDHPAPAPASVTPSACPSTGRPSGEGPSLGLTESTTPTAAGGTASGDAEEQLVKQELAPRASESRVADLVSGEVLEALKGAGGGVQGNGGLLITFLLDDWQAPIIAPEGCTASEVLRIIEGRELYAPLTLPPEFDTPTCPHSVFGFVEEGLPVPPHITSKAERQ